MKVAFFANTDWYLFNFRLSLAKFLKSKGLEVLMISPPGKYSSRFEGLGFKWLALEMDRRSLHPLREGGLVLRLSRLLRAEKVDMLHCFTIKPVVYGAIAAKLSKTPYRISAITGLGHVFTCESPLVRWLRLPVRLMLRFALNGTTNRLILQNREDANIFNASRLIAETRVHLIPGSGVDTDRFKPLPTSHAGENKFRVLLASRLLWEKGIAEYVEAARILRRAGRSVEFHLAGAPDPGNPSSVTQDQVEEWRREGIVNVLGHVADMHDILRSVDLAVLPSYREGIPRSLLEAAAAGLPLVATDTPGCREVVRHGVNGLLVPCRNPGALADAIAFLMDRLDECRKMGAAGRSIVLKEYDEKIVLEKTFDVYRAVCGFA